MWRAQHRAYVRLWGADIGAAAADSGTMPRAMNAPHVDALVFRIEHGPAVAYSDDAPSIDHEEPGFRVTLKDGTVRFALKEHHATEEEALEAVLPYIRGWELDASLHACPGDFRLRLDRAEVIDRQRPQSKQRTLNVSASRIAVRWTTGNVKVTLTRPAYPSPPAGVTLRADDPDVETMYDRLSRYYAGHEPLPSMVYFCLTMLEYRSPGRGRQQRHGAAVHHHISKRVLTEIAKLASNGGGVGSARKASATSTELSQPESRFLEAAVKMIIRRAAEVAQDPDAALPTITLADLPERS